MRKRRAKNDRCIFCGTVFGSSDKNSRASREHYWGKSLQKIFPRQIDGGRGHYETVLEKGKLTVNNRGFLAKGGPALNATVSDAVCVHCNTGWLSEIQEVVGELVEYVQGADANKISICGREIEAFRRWIATRISLHLFSYPGPWLKVNLEAGAVEDHCIVLQGEHADALKPKASDLLPSNWRVFVGLAKHRTKFDPRPFESVAVNLITGTLYFDESACRAENSVISLTSVE